MRVDSSEFLFRSAASASPSAHRFSLVVQIDLDSTLDRVLQAELGSYVITRLVVIRS